MKEKVDFDRKDLKGPDAFVESVGRTAKYVQENRARVIAAVAAVVVAFVAAVGWHGFRERRANESAAGFMRATDALDLDSPATAKAAFDNVVKRSGGVYRELAVLYQAGIAVDEERYADALKLYDDVARSGPTSYVRQVASMGKGFVLETTGKAVGAVAAYGAAADIAGPYRQQALRDRLRAALAAGDTKTSEAAIEKLLELYPESDDADELSSKLAAIRGKD